MKFSCCLTLLLVSELGRNNASAFTAPSAFNRNKNAINRVDSSLNMVRDYFFEL